jgi:hypothetical protein
MTLARSSASTSGGNRTSSVARGRKLGLAS